MVSMPHSDGMVLAIIVLLAIFSVPDQAIGGRDLLEFLFGFGIAGIEVGMEPFSQVCDRLFESLPPKP